jgi:hypothetical protein
MEKHEQLMAFIVGVAEMGFSREAHRMLTGSAVPRLTHILKSVPMDHASIEWMQSVDDIHLSTWLKCVGAEQLDAALAAPKKALPSGIVGPPSTIWRSRLAITCPSCRRGATRILGSNHC